MDRMRSLGVPVDIADPAYTAISEIHFFEKIASHFLCFNIFKQKSLNCQNDHHKMRAKLGASPFYSCHHHWTKMDKIHIAPALYLSEAASPMGWKSAVRGSNPPTASFNEAWQEPRQPSVNNREHLWTWSPSRSHRKDTQEHQRTMFFISPFGPLCYYSLPIDLAKPLWQKTTSLSTPNNHYEMP